MNLDFINREVKRIEKSRNSALSFFKTKAHFEKKWSKKPVTITQEFLDTVEPLSTAIKTGNTPYNYLEIRDYVANTTELCDYIKSSGVSLESFVKLEHYSDNSVVADHLSEAEEAVKNLTPYVDNFKEDFILVYLTARAIDNMLYVLEKATNQVSRVDFAKNSTLNAIVAGKTYSLEDFYEEQEHHFEKVKHFMETNSEKADEYRSLPGFMFQYEQYIESIQAIQLKIVLS